MTDSRKRVAILCGGPSAERGISLNSARCVYDHLHETRWEKSVIYFAPQGQQAPLESDLPAAFELSPHMLYSNTPGDFDCTLARQQTPLGSDLLRESLQGVDVVFPVLHGTFGEDGHLQRVLEQWGCVFVGSPSDVCSSMFDKMAARRRLAGIHETVEPAIAFGVADACYETVEGFVGECKGGRVVIKPVRGGSSIGMCQAQGVEQTWQLAQQLLAGEGSFLRVWPQGEERRVMVELRREGVEFTVIVVEAPDGSPVALVPLEIQCDGLFTERKKYFATEEVSYHCPPVSTKFTQSVIGEIRRRAERVFDECGMRSIARIDGWLLEDGRIVFCDFNPIGGMDQNSLIFMQAGQVGLEHEELFEMILARTLGEADGLDVLSTESTSSFRHKVNVLFGGIGSERHVSVLSGSNVWLKLRGSKKYCPTPFLLTKTEQSSLDEPEYEVWRLPPAYGLFPSADNIVAACRRSEQDQDAISVWRTEIRRRLGLKLLDPVEERQRLRPLRMTLEEYLDDRGDTFLALHGGIGEDGTLQHQFDSAGIRYTGSDAKSSQICMDKERTAASIRPLRSDAIRSAVHRAVSLDELRVLTESEACSYWEKLVEQLQTDTIVAKPVSEGCSVGVVRLASADELTRYIASLIQRIPRLDGGVFRHHPKKLEMPKIRPARLLLEEYIDTARIRVKGMELVSDATKKWIEITIGLSGRKGSMKSLLPSLTVAEGSTLSQEEKFQKGMGINLTPPPADVLSESIIQSTRRKAEKIARHIGLHGLSRIDAFIHRETGEMIVIEVNTLPAMSSATVLYHQALAANPSRSPRVFLEDILRYSQIG